MGASFRTSQKVSSSSSSNNCLKINPPNSADAQEFIGCSWSQDSCPICLKKNVNGPKIRESQSLEMNLSDCRKGGSISPDQASSVRSRETALGAQTKSLVSLRAKLAKISCLSWQFSS